MFSTTHRGRAAMAGLACCVVLAAPATAQRIVYGATLDGAQEVPPNGSTGTGQGTFLIDKSSNQIFYYITFSGLTGTETTAHIHGFASPGTNGSILTPLPAGNPKIGVFVYPEVDEASYLDGLAYVNIHSTAFPGGELRGQILPDNTPNRVLYAALDESQGVPPSGSTATGEGFFVIDTTANTVDFIVLFTGLVGNETTAHIHGFAAPGMNGVIQLPLVSGSPKVGTWFYGEPDETSILGGLSYVNVHSDMFAAGEIRGQIELVENTFTYCSGKLSSLACTPFLTFNGRPSASSTATFQVVGNDFLPSEAGFMLYGVAGKSNLNFHGGKLCVKARFTRWLPPKIAKNTGPPPCTGILRRNFNSRIQSGVDPSLTVGQQVNAQFRQRDPADSFGFGDALSDGIQFVIEP